MQLFKEPIYIYIYIYIYICLSVFPISEKHADRFPWNLAWFIGVIGRLEWIKTSRKFRPLMCKNFGKRCKIAHKTVPTGNAGWHVQWLRTKFARWPVLACVRQWHMPIGRGPGGVASSLPCGTVSNATKVLRTSAPRGVGLQSNFPASLWPDKPLV